MIVSTSNLEKETPLHRLITARASEHITTGDTCSLIINCRPFRIAIASTTSTPTDPWKHLAVAQIRALLESLATAPTLKQPLTRTREASTFTLNPAAGGHQDENELGGSNRQPGDLNSSFKFA
ncbi:hypothetical protein ACOSP7_002171 [Xanthoceras sorbifolium]